MPHNLNDYILLSIDSSMAFSLSLSCANLVGIASLNCALFNSTTLVMTFNSFLGSTTIQFNIKTIRNYDVSTGLRFSASVYSSDNYLK